MAKRPLYWLAMHLIVLGGKIARKWSRGSERYGNVVVDELRPDLFVLQQEGTDNPVSVIFLRRRGRRTWAYVTDPGKQWHSFGKNETFQRLARNNGWTLAGVFLTHAHVDHWGNLNFYRARLPRHGRVYVHPKGHAAMENPNAFAAVQEQLARQGRSHFRTNRLWRALYWLWPAYVRAGYGFGIRPLKPVGTPGGVLAPMPQRPFRLNGGATVEVRHLPGHAPDEVLFWLPEDRIAVLGDLVPPQQHAERGAIVSAYVPEADVVQAVSSVAALDALQPRVLVPAHGAPITGDDVHATLVRLERYTQRIVDRLREIWRLRPFWEATAVGRCAFSSLGIVLNRNIGLNEMTSYAASVRRHDDATTPPSRS